MGNREKFSNWAKRKWADAPQDRQEYAVNAEMSRFDSMTAGMPEKEKEAFVEDWIKNDELNEKIVSFSRRAAALPPSSIGEAKRILEEFERYAEKLKRDDPEAYKRHEQTISHVSMAMASIVKHGRIGAVR